MHIRQARCIGLVIRGLEAVLNATAASSGCVRRDQTFRALQRGGLVANFETANGTGFFQPTQAGWVGQICAVFLWWASTRVAEELVQEHQLHDHDQRAEHHEAAGEDASWPFKGR